MGSLNKFLAKPQEITIKGNVIALHPLKAKDMHLFSNQDATDAEKVKMSMQIMKLSIPDSTDAEIDELPMDTFTKLMEEINKLNGFKDDRIDRVRKNIKQRQAGD